MVHQDLQAHLAECAEVTFPCSGAPCGCSFVSKREELAEHSATCALAALAPAFNAQKARLDRQEIALKDLWRRNEILEGGFSSIQAILGGSGNETDAALLPSTSSAVLPGLPGTDSSAAESQSQPFDSAMHHLLSLYESLREEVDRVSAAVSELDAKSSVMLMNESLRTKEDLAHTNAALNSMRMQLHWLMSARLQTQPRTAAAAAAAGVAGPSNRPRGGGGDGGPNLPTRRLSGRSLHQISIHGLSD